MYSTLPSFQYRDARSKKGKENLETAKRSRERFAKRTMGLEYMRALPSVSVFHMLDKVFLNKKPARGLVLRCFISCETDS
jgi:hypothetical protein